MIDWRQEPIDLRNELAEETKRQIEGAYTLTLRVLALSRKPPGAPPFPIRTPEAARLLDAAIRLKARRARKGLLAGCFELIRQAEIMSGPPEAPGTLTRRDVL
jgi:hypothetical protein